MFLVFESNSTQTYISTRPRVVNIPGKELLDKFVLNVLYDTSAERYRTHRFVRAVQHRLKLIELSTKRLLQKSVHSSEDTDGVLQIQNSFQSIRLEFSHNIFKISHEVVSDRLPQDLAQIHPSSQKCNVFL